MIRTFAGFLVAVFCLSLTLAAQENSVPSTDSGQAGRQGWGNQRGIWLDVPFVAQEKDGCGAAALAMVIRYWQQHGRAVQSVSDPAEIQRTLFSKEAHGIYTSAMQHYLDTQGFRTFAFAGTRADLRRHLEKGRPLILALEPGNGSPLHYVVVVGMDEDRRLVLVNDPAQKKLLKLDQASLEREWNAADKWTLLAVPQSGPQ